MNHPSSLETYLLHRGRPLERALTALDLGRPGAPAALLEALEAYRNPDGGFGRALEPDFRAQASSVLATNRALELLAHGRALGVQVAEAAQPAVAWLVAAYRPDLEAWPLVGPGGFDEPHAPWWNPKGLAERFGGFGLNPSLEATAWILEFGTPDQAAWARGKVPVLARRLEAEGAWNQEMVLPILHKWHRLDSCPPAIRAWTAAHLADRTVQRTEVRPEAWGDYCWKPFQAAPTPQAPGAERLAEAVRASLAWELGRLAPGEGVVPHWTWGGAFPEAWEEAKAEWTSVITYELWSAARAWA